MRILFLTFWHSYQTSVQSTECFHSATLCLDCILGKSVHLSYSSASNKTFCTLNMRILVWKCVQTIGHSWQTSAQSIEWFHSATLCCLYFRHVIKFFWTCRNIFDVCTFSKLWILWHREIRVLIWQCICHNSKKTSSHHMWNRQKDFDPVRLFLDLLVNAIFPSFGFHCFRTVVVAVEYRATHRRLCSSHFEFLPLWKPVCTDLFSRFHDTKNATKRKYNPPRSPASICFVMSSVFNENDIDVLPCD